MSTIQLDGNSLTINDVVEVARHNSKASISAPAKARVEKCRELIDKLVKRGEAVYGVNTGVGALANVRIKDSEIELLQKNLIMSHATGVGNPLPIEVVRAVMLIKANALSKGYSGVRPIVIDTLISMLNKGVHPIIPEKGSVGASGDLAPLSHIVLVMMGLGEAAGHNGRKISGIEALKGAGIKPITLKSKEGLALINGTEIMTAIAALAVHDTEIVLRTAQVASAMSLEALMGTTKPFDPRIHKLRPHKGQMMCAQNVLTLTKGSKIITSHKDCGKVQDAYTLRCMAQVYGATLDALAYAKNEVSIEINSTTDNPIVFPETGEVISGGNFHGEPIAFAMDFLGIALAEIGDISERTTYRLVDHNLSEMPSFLTKKGGLYSGFMITQYTAASLVSENKVLSHPASTDSIPTSAGQEDHVSMGTISARKAREILSNVEYIVAIELLCAAQGLEFHAPLKPGAGVLAAHRFIRKHIPKLDEDRIMYPDIEKMRELVGSGDILNAVKAAVGELN